MAQSLQIKNLNETHLAIMDRLILEPSLPRADLAREMGISRTHLSVIINSDAFKAALAERRNEINAPVLASLREKLTALADSTLDKMIAKIEDEGGDLDTLNKVLKNATGSLGMGVPAGGGGLVVNQQNNHFNVDRETLGAARQLMHQIAEKRKLENEGNLLEGEHEDGGTHD